MHAHSDYTIKLVGTEHDRKKAAAILGELLQENFDEAGFIETGVAEIEETYEVVFFEDIVDMAERIAGAAANAELTINGTVDTSESAGEYMDFDISYKDGLMTTRSSDWYLYPDDVEGMTYEEYLAEYDSSCTKEDFELIEKIKEAIRETTKIGCTGCNYCMPCPKGVDIPATFLAWNRMYAEKRSSARHEYIQSVGLRKEPAFASQCVKCGKWCGGSKNPAFICHNCGFGGKDKNCVKCGKWCP